MAGLLAEARLPVAALLGGAEFIFEKRIILGPDYGEVVTHLENLPFLSVVLLEIGWGMCCDPSGRMGGGGPMEVGIRA